jgi:hypothetical protein
MGASSAAGSRSRRLNMGMDGHAWGPNDLEDGELGRPMERPWQRLFRQGHYRCLLCTC